MVKLNKVKERLVYLAPAVQAGWDDQSSIADFNVIELLGQGSFGRVKKMKHKKTGKVYAIKELDKKEIKARKMVDQVKNELKIMYSLNHSNIIMLYSHFEDDFSIYLIMEYAENGHLYGYLMKSQKKRLPEEEAQHFIAQISSAIDYIHQKGIIHRDIKPQNILLDSKMNVKLCDFGWSNFQKGQLKRTTFCGTLDYLAPEMVEEGHQHDLTVDIWALGVLIYELCTGNSPFSFGLMDNTESQKKVKSNIINIKFSPPPSFLSESCKDLISQILKKYPKERPTVTEITSSSWLSKTPIPEERNYSGELKKELQITNDDPKTFTKEEIYSFSRFESIINEKKDEQKDKLKDKNSKPGEFEARMRQMEIKRAQDQEELYRLRKFRQEHTDCDKKIMELEKSYVLLKREMDEQYLKLARSEAQVRELQLQLSKYK